MKLYHFKNIIVIPGIISSSNNYFIKNNPLVSGSINNTIEGSQIYINISKIKINGGIIQNSNNILNITSNISPDEKGNKKAVSSYGGGGAIFLPNCKNFEINTFIFIIINCSDFFISYSIGGYFFIFN